MENYNGSQVFLRQPRVTELDRSQVTVLLKAWRGGDRTALERLTPLLYDELKRLARKFKISFVSSM